MPTSTADTAARRALLLLLPLLLAVGVAEARRDPRLLGRCMSSVGEIDKDTMMKIVRNLQVTDETSIDEKCMLRCVLMSSGMVREYAVDTQQIVMNIREDVGHAGRMASTYGQNISVDFDRLSSDMEGCVTPVENPDCDTFYNQFKCVSDLIASGNMANYASFVEVDGSESADWMRWRMLMGGRPRGPPPGRGRGGPRGGHRRGGRPPPPPPPPESEPDDNDVEEIEP